MGNRVAVARIVLPVLIASFCCVSTSAAREAKPQNSPAATNPSGVYLVFPFENDGSSPHLDWLGEGLEQLTISRLSAGGEQVYSRAGRIGELERYGLPASAKLSHATMLRMAQDLDADDVIIGSFHSDGTTLTMQARILVVNPAALLPEVKESGPL
ncbi:MAG TPA: hypothetical protein VJP87_03230, partial [Candidatus Acidoferrales bacterium]|nr:hypothetical protein [Candidatus Acidoferrales bacterium]